MLTYGFYNSLNGDRKYDAVQMSSIFDGVIEDGVYANVGEFFAVIAGTGMNVIVKTGRAWFDHTWTLLDSHLPLDIEESDFLQTRIDAVVLEVDSRIEKRENSIKVVKGIPSVNPVKPNLLHEQGVYQHALAYVTVAPEVTSLTAENIEIVVGKDETPFVQCPLKTVSISDLFNQWDAEFTSWFDNIKLQLTSNVVTNLQRQIDEKVNIADKATEEDIKDKNPDKWVSAGSIGSVINDPGDGKYSFNDLEDSSDGSYVNAYGTILSANILGDSANSFAMRNRFPDPIKIDVPSVPPTERYDANGTRPVCCTLKLSIGDYSYFPIPNKSFCKFNWTTKKQDSIVDIGIAPSCYGIVGNYLVVSSGYKMYVYDQNLSLVRSIDIKIGTTNAQIDWFAQTNDSTIVCLARVGSSQSTIMYTTDLFQTILTASINVALEGGDCYTGGSKNEYIRSIAFPSPGALIQKDNTGKLYFKARVSNCVYVSETYGLSWIKHDMPSDFNCYNFVVYNNSFYWFTYPSSSYSAKKCVLYKGTTLDDISEFSSNFIQTGIPIEKYTNGSVTSYTKPVFLNDGIIEFYIDNDSVAGNSGSVIVFYLGTGPVYKLDLNDGTLESLNTLVTTNRSNKSSVTYANAGCCRLCNVGKYAAIITELPFGESYPVDYYGRPLPTYSMEMLPKGMGVCPPFSIAILISKENDAIPITHPLVYGSPDFNSTTKKTDFLYITSGWTAISFFAPFPIENGIVFTMYDIANMPDVTNYLLIETDKRQLPYDPNMYIKME